MPRNIHILKVAGALLLLALICFQGTEALLIPTAHAAAGLPGTLSGGFIAGVSFVAGLLITILNTLTWFLFMLIDIVLNPVWIFDLQANGADGSLVNMLREIWQLCRDLVNLALAFTLIVGAIMMIITADSSKIKGALPKFVMALVLVNFSWFIPRVIFDVSQIATYTVYQIPSLLSADGCVLPASGNLPARPCEMVTNYAFFQETELVRPDGVLTNAQGNPVSSGWQCPLRPLVCIQTAPFGSPEATVNAQMHSNVLNGLIVNHARLQQLVRLSDPQPFGVGGIAGGAVDQFTASITFLVKIVIILLFHIALFFPLLALAAAFFLRIPVLWVTMAFMPLVALSYVIPDNFFGELNPKKVIMDQFLGAVFLPVKVAVPFTIGFIMVNAGAQAAPPEMLNQFAPIAVFSGISSIWQMLWMAIAMFIIWKYSFEALKTGGDVANMFTDKIKGFGDATLNLAKQVPLSIPFIPIPGGGNASLRELGRSLSPRQALAELDTGLGLRSPASRLSDLVNRRQNTPPPGSPPLVTPQMSAVSNALNPLPQATTNPIRTHLTQAAAAGLTPATRLPHLIQAVQAARAATGGAGGPLNGLTDRDVLEGILRSNLGISQADQTTIRQAIYGPGGISATQVTP